MLQDLKDWTRWLARWLARWLIIGFIGLIVLWLLPIGRDSADGVWPHRSGVAVVTDAETGCQYLRTPGGGITPRVDADGNQLGCAKQRRRSAQR